MSFNSAAECSDSAQGFVPSTPPRFCWRGALLLLFFLLCLSFCSSATASYHRRFATKCPVRRALAGCSAAVAPIGARLPTRYVATHTRGVVSASLRPTRFGTQRATRPKKEVKKLRYCLMCYFWSICKDANTKGYAGRECTNGKQRTTADVASGLLSVRSFQIIFATQQRRSQPKPAPTHCSPVVE